MNYRRIYKNTAEQDFCLWIENQGYYPTKRGWPDFFCRRKDGKIIAVEVKPHSGEYLKKDQLLIMAHLVELGMPCFRWDPETKQLQPIASISSMREGSGLPTSRKASAMPDVKRSDRR